ncbi:hypothetical protein HH303_07575 [Rhodospirillaceae bacterium KN72]|uniref:Capsule biosynthesis protein n=1 Tax=Pacificispira spongiicola TaxID=2729598 RepID=A0A7Y0HF91_9PROT|nr:DUF6356 family protein [Pacificispira spongiicola]NMM44333.1 hypothetical protein [Pacificispira spongiicola]
MASNLFTRHPASVGESYGEHFGTALSFAGPLLVAGLCCLVHAILPFAFERTGSKMVTRLYDRMVAHRVKPGNEARMVAQPAE